jgi:class 3 adenylate cyclase/CheY-like chemotaxis protein
MSAKILAVDDNPRNVKLLVELLKVHGYTVLAAESGEAALKAIAEEHPDLVLLDVMMPGMSGYEVCQAIRANPDTAVLPVVLVTALDPNERVKGLEVGADDFLTKPVNQSELLARVRSLLRIKQYHAKVEGLAAELAELNHTLEDRVRTQVAEIDRLGKLKRFFSPQLARSIVDGGDDLLKPHRREVTVMFLDLRGFTAFTGEAEPEDVMNVLGEYHQLIGELLRTYPGTLERFSGDGVMIFFNDPLPVPDAVEQAVRMACDLHGRFEVLRAGWSKRGYELDLGIGIAQGYATLGAIGFEDRWDYAAIGAVTNLAARLCAEAQGGQILTNQRTYSRIEALVQAKPLGELALKGLPRPVAVFNIRGLSP